MISNNDMETKIARAREFANRSLIGYDPSVANKDDYFMFQISKFLLLKESMIKKDSDNNKIYFNIVNNYRYFKIIRCIVDYFRKYGGVLISNDIEVVIEPSNYTLSSELKSYILDFHRIRDSIAHGGYHIDSSGGYIVFDNNNLDSVRTITSMYAIKGKLPIEILELFTYISNSPKDIYSENEIDGFIANVKTARKQYGYNVEEKNIYNIIKEYNSINDDLFEYDFKNIPDDKNVYIDTYNIYNDNLRNISERYDYKNNNEIITKVARKKEAILQQLINALINDKKYPTEQKKQFLRLLQKYELITSNTSIDNGFVITSKQPSRSYIQKLEIVIDEISSIMKMKNNSDDAIKVSSVYNYMQLYLSFNHDSINKRNKNNLGALKISRINPIFLSVNNGGKPDEQILQTINNYINAKLLNTDSGLRKLLQQYAKNPNEALRKSIIKLLFTSYDKLQDYLASRNIYIINSIRNSLEHGNIDPVETGEIMLHDQSNQNDPTTKNFECIGSPQDFYDIISCIDLDKDQDFTFDDFMIEMKEILDKDLFDKFVTVVVETKDVLEKNTSKEYTDFVENVRRFISKKEYEKFKKAFEEQYSSILKRSGTRKLIKGKKQLSVRFYGLIDKIKAVFHLNKNKKTK